MTGGVLGMLRLLAHEQNFLAASMVWRDRDERS
jgi:hypothetical protein